MSHLRPYSTLLIGVVIGYVVVPKIMARVGS